MTSITISCYTSKPEQKIEQKLFKQKSFQYFNTARRAGILR